MTIVQQRGLYRKGRAILLLVASLCALTSCLTWSSGDNVSSKEPDKVLFDRAISAAEHHRFDVANLTLQTLVNTYPDSEYAVRAERLLENPPIAQCGVSGDMKFLTGSSSPPPPVACSPPSELDSFPPSDLE